MLESPFNNVADQTCNFIKKHSNIGVFLWNLSNFSEHYFDEHLRTTASGFDILVPSQNIHFFPNNATEEFSESFFIKK